MAGEEEFTPHPNPPPQGEGGSVAGLLRSAPSQGHSAADLIAALHEARERTLTLAADLSDVELMGPRLPIVNPMLWEIGHVAWFNEYWVLRHFLGEAPIMENSDVFYNSATIPHDWRWE